MARASKYKYEKGDVIGLYTVIKVLPDKGHVRNLRIWCVCNLCDEKVTRYANRLESTHQGCVKAKDIRKVKRKPRKKPVEVLPHTRADGSVVEVGKDGHPLTKPASDAVQSADTLGLIDSNITDALNFDVNTMAAALVAKAEAMDDATKYTYLATVRRYLGLVEHSRRIERQLEDADYVVTGSSGNNVVNPLVRELKSLSAESNSTLKVLNGIAAKSGVDDEKDPLMDLLNNFDSGNEDDNGGE